MSKRVVIIGGGFSGLAAGVRLAERGWPVLLLERRPHLGGRAYSFIDSQTNDSVDNGQHLFMGCYRSTIAFLEKIGSLDKLKFQERTRVDFLDRSNRFSSFACPPLPAPLHVVAGLLNMEGITFRDRVRALSVGRAIRKASATDQKTVDDWLDDLGQSQRMRERFWYPMIIATLNESPAVASARMLQKVLQEAFGGDRQNSSIGISSVGLSDLYTTGARAFIESRGGEVRLRAQVCSIETEGGQVAGLRTKDGERVTGDYFISTMPPQ
ncbi:MAG TPA: FAD-dependent oxidoreductase, partial [Blastocatellia bacterium]|nr:FAD-dependent oxidoreductase [Blastocatellia bacterium]